MLDEDALAFYDDALPGWTSENGLFEVLVGELGAEDLADGFLLNGKGAARSRNAGKCKSFNTGFHAG